MEEELWNFFFYLQIQAYQQLLLYIYIQGVHQKLPVLNADNFLKLYSILMKIPQYIGHTYDKKVSECNNDWKQKFKAFLFYKGTYFHLHRKNWNEKIKDILEFKEISRCMYRNIQIKIVQ